MSYQPPIVAVPYGLEAIGEQKTGWSYYLRDGLGSVRQVTNAAGGVLVSRSFTPWGEVSEQSGSGDITWGYFGGLLDAATGLIYVGNGQYYDPASGRFLTRQARPSGGNPYVPWGGDPSGALIGPLALLALVGWRKRGKNRAGAFLLLCLLVVALGAVGMAACEPPTQPPPPTSTQTGIPVSPTQPPPTDTSHPTDTPSPTGVPGFSRAIAKQYAMDHYADPSKLYYDFENAGVQDWNDCTNFVSQALYEGGLRDPRQKIPPSDVPFWGQMTREKTQALIDNGSNLNEISTWTDANDLYFFLLHRIGATPVFKSGGYHKPPIISNEYISDTGWEKKLAENRSNIQDGDVAFYNYGAGWRHAALIVGWGKQTFYTLDGTPTPTFTPTPDGVSTLCPPLPDKPRILDRSSALSDRVDREGRSLDNVTSSINYIEILHLPY